MPSHNMSPGDIVALSPSHEQIETTATGIVSQVRQKSVSIAFDESLDALDLDADTEKYKLVKLANDITYKRLRRALGDLKNYRSGPSNHLVNVLFGSSELKPPLNITNDLVFLNENLDASQREAVKFALNQSDVAIIHGPPGTGKTTTVIEIIRQAISLKMKVLACAPSNIAVDNLVERLGEKGSRIVRLGHPARVLHNIQKYSLDAILSYSDETKLVEDVRRDMDQTMAKMKKVKDRGSRQSLREDMKHLRKELRERESAATKDILRRADVVLSTLTSATRDGPLKYLEDGHFDLVVIDECSQALEAACWIALLNGPRCILAGDHQQLPPTIMSKKAAKDGLEVTLMERVLKQSGDQVMRMLTTQYRMNELIMQWSSEQLYNGKLVAHESVAKHLLSDLPEVEDSEETRLPLLLIDTAGCDLPELQLPEQISKANEGEADLVAVHVESLISSGVKPETIAVIAPYNLQVELLRMRLAHKYQKLEIKSVDSFQGREKEAVVISLVRSNEKGEVGFLAEDRRINVAITRARRHLAVICDTQTVGHHGFLKSLVDYMSGKGEVRSAHQYQQDHSIGETSQRPAHLTDQLKQTANQGGAKPKVNKKQNKEKGKPKSTATDRREGPAIKREAPVPVDNDQLLELQLTVESFANNSQRKEHAFPSVLTSRERRLIHEVCEQLGLIHVSQGEGDKRHIVMRKKEKNDAKKEQSGTSSIHETNKNVPKIFNDFEPALKMDPEMDEKSEVQIEGKQKRKNKKKKKKEHSSGTFCDGEVTDGVNDKQVEGVNEDVLVRVETPGIVVCEKCGKGIPKNNYDLHLLRCGTFKEQQVEAQGVMGAGSYSQRASANSGVGNIHVGAKSKKGAKPKTKGVKLLENIDGDDFDALIAAASKVDNVCNFVRCKTSTTCVGQKCDFCALRFCLSHHIPEVHGCGDEAKLAARQTLIREGVLYRGSGVPNKKPNAQKKAYLQGKLDKAMNEKAGQRQKKKKEDKK
ncbi:DNA-binding protein SMUBP-2-like isoform X2 [Lineus longissimus]